MRKTAFFSSVRSGVATRFAVSVALVMTIMLSAAYVFNVFEPIGVKAEVSSCAEMVMEAESGRELFSLHADEKLPMASTTKILTALIIIEDCDLNEIVTVPASCAGVEGSSIYLVTGEKISVKNLLYGLMLRSGNDCAETLAVFHSGSIEAFADVMNERAKLMGTENSSFKNPHGLPADDHYTTARDLARIACRAMKNPVFREIVSAKSAVIPDGGCGYERRLENKNKMLVRYEDANGVKTGYTKAAGRCLVTAAKRSGMQLVSVVLNSPAMYERSAEILDEAFARYSYEKVFSADMFSVTVHSDVKGKDCRLGCKEDFYYPITEKERELVRLETEVPASVRLPVFKGQDLGILRIYLANQLIFSEKIYSIDTVKKTWTDVLRQIAERFVGREEECASINFLRNAALRAGAPAIS